LSDAIRGDTSLFTQDACVEAAWRVVDPVLKGGQPVLEYDPGSWGPTPSNGIVSGEEGWRNPTPEKSLPC
jgi:glucose-6-phosphate 1-dehydrogenase